VNIEAERLSIDRRAMRFAIDLKMDHKPNRVFLVSERIRTCSPGLGLRADIVPFGVEP
jgi:hypothetical protein